MDRLNWTFILSVFFALIGILLIASGLNGFVVLDGFDMNYTGELCETTQDCSETNVCCIFTNENSGACMSQDKCTQFLVMPLKTVEPPNLLPPWFGQGIQILSGLLIVLISGLILYYSNKTMIKSKSM